MPKLGFSLQNYQHKLEDAPATMPPEHEQSSKIIITVHSRPDLNAICRQSTPSMLINLQEVPISADQSITEIDCIKQIQCSSLNSAETLHLQSDLVSLNEEIINYNSSKGSQVEQNFILQVEQVQKNIRTIESTCPSIPPEQMVQDTLQQQQQQIQQQQYQNIINNNNQQQIYELNHFEGIDENETSNTNPSIISIQSPQNNPNYYQSLETQQKSINKKSNDTLKIQLINICDEQIDLLEDIDSKQEKSKKYKNSKQSSCYYSPTPQHNRNAKSITNYNTFNCNLQQNANKMQQIVTSMPTKSMQSIPVLDVKHLVKKQQHQRVRTSLQSYQDHFISQQQQQQQNQCQDKYNQIFETKTGEDDEDSFEQACKNVDKQLDTQENIQYSNTERISIYTQQHYDDLFKSTQSQQIDMTNGGNMMGLYKQYTQNYGSMPTKQMQKQNQLKSHNTKSTSVNKNSLKTSNTNISSNRLQSQLYNNHNLKSDSKRTVKYQKRSMLMGNTKIQNQKQNSNISQTSKVTMHNSIINNNKSNINSRNHNYNNSQNFNRNQSTNSNNNSINRQLTSINNQSINDKFSNSTCKVQNMKSRLGTNTYHSNSIVSKHQNKYSVSSHKRDTYSFDLDNLLDMQVQEIGKSKEKRKHLQAQQNTLTLKHQKLQNQTKKLKNQTTILQQQIYDQEQNNLQIAIENRTMKMQIEELKNMIQEKQNENFIEQQELIEQKRECVQNIQKLQCLSKQEKSQEEFISTEQKDEITKCKEKIDFLSQQQSQFKQEISYFNKKEQAMIKIIKQKEYLLEQVIKEEDSEEENKSFKKSRKSYRQKKQYDRNSQHLNDSFINKVQSRVREPLSTRKINTNTPQNKENTENFYPFKSFNQGITVNFKKKPSIQTNNGSMLNNSSSLNYSKTCTSREEFKRLHIN